MLPDYYFYLHPLLINKSIIFLLNYQETVEMIALMMNRFVTIIAIVVAFLVGTSFYLQFLFVGILSQSF